MASPAAGVCSCFRRAGSSLLPRGSRRAACALSRGCLSGVSILQMRCAGDPVVEASCGSRKTPAAAARGAPEHWPPHPWAFSVRIVGEGGPRCRFFQDFLNLLDLLQWLPASGRRKGLGVPQVGSPRFQQLPWEDEGGHLETPSQEGLEEDGGHSELLAL